MPALENPRQEAFCQYRVFGGPDKRPMTIPAAYKAAGYQGKTKSSMERLAAEPAVRARILELKETREKQNLRNTVYTRETVIGELLENVQESKRGIVTHKGAIVYARTPEGDLILDELGDPVPVMRRDARAINQALELLGSELGMFPKINKLEHSKANPFEGLTTEEIAIELRNTMIHELGWDMPIDDLFRLIGQARAMHQKPLEIARDRILPARTE